MPSKIILINLKVCKNKASIEVSNFTQGDNKPLTFNVRNVTANFWFKAATVQQPVHARVN